MAKLAWLVPLLLAAPVAALELVTPENSRRSDDNPKWYTARDRVFDEARPDFLRLQYERLFGEQWPDEGWHVLDRFRPFEDNQKLDNAMDRYYFNRVDAQVKDELTGVTLVVRAPGTSEQRMKVWINRDRVLLSFAPDEAGESKWHFVRPTEQSLPLPGGADYKTARVTREGETVTIAFQKKG